MNNSGSQVGSQVEYVSPENLAQRHIRHGEGELYNIFLGPVQGSVMDQLEDNFIFTSEGAIPLSAEAARLAERYSAASSEGQLMFPMQTDPYRDVVGRDFEESDLSQLRNNFMTNIFEEEQEEAALPPGVIRGLPEGADPKDYIVVGNDKRSFGDPITDKDEKFYVKILSRPEQNVPGTPVAPEPPPPIHPPAPPPDPAPQEPLPEPRVIQHPEEDRPPIAPRPFKQEEIYEYIVDDPYQNEDAPPEIYDSDYDSFGDQPVSAETERYKDPLFTPNLLASIASGLGDVNLGGVSYQVPRYDQDVYASQQLGPAVQNLFRGR